MAPDGRAIRLPTEELPLAKPNFAFQKRQKELEKKRKKEEKLKRRQERSGTAPEDTAATPPPPEGEKA